MPQLTVFGATRPMGREAIRRALEKPEWERVVALIRKGEAALPADLAQHPNRSKLTVVQGDATIEEDVARAVNGSSAVLAFLGTGNSIKSTVNADFSKILVKVLASAPDTKVVTISSIAATDLGLASQGFISRFIHGTILGAINGDKRAMETTFASSNLTHWTALRAGRLTDKPANLERIRLPDEKEVNAINAMKPCSRYDVGALALEIVEGKREGFWGRGRPVFSG